MTQGTLADVETAEPLADAGGEPESWQIGLYFDFFTEIGILQQLTRATLESVLPEGIIQPHFTVLDHLERVSDGRTPLDLARAFQVPKTSISHTLAGLERHGLVRLAPNPRDKRSKLVWITEEGRALRAGTAAGLAQLLGEFARAFPPEQVADLGPVLARMRAWLDAEREG